MYKRFDLVAQGKDAQDEHKSEVKRLINQGIKLNQVSQYREALQVFEQALQISHRTKYLYGKILALSNLGNAYNYIGQYEKAIEHSQQALAIVNLVGLRDHELRILNNLGIVYYMLGQYEKAFEHCKKALVIAREIGDREGEAGAVNELALLYGLVGKQQKAIDYHQQSLAIARQNRDLIGEGSSLGNLGMAYYAIGQYEKAIEYYKQSLTIYRQIGNLKGEGAMLNEFGLVYDVLGQYEKAIEYHQHALAIKRQTGDRQAEGSSLNNLGLSFFHSNNLIHAEQTLRSAIQVHESLRANSGNDTNKVSIFEGQASTYRILQQVLIAQKRPSIALEISERGRARALVELLASNLKHNDAAQPNPLPPQITEIQQIAKTHQLTLVEYSIINDKFKIDNREHTKESELYIWVISPNGQITFRSVDLKPLWQKQTTSLSELVENSRKGIGVNDRDSTGIKIVLNPEYRQQLRQEQSKYLRQLHQILIEPIADLLPTDPNARVVFMPQSALYLVPFAALQDKSEQYLIQKHTIAISPSIQVLSLTQQQRLALPAASARSSQNILIAGNPIMPKVFVPGIDQPLRLDDLQGAQKEAIAVANTLKTTALTGNQATKKAVVQQMQSARIIHLATHGLLDDFKGLGVPGAIALAPDGNGSTNDGLLTADEILGMKLKAELVVLSACNTGRGKITGDGVIGLSRSLISAGVPSIIVSLWSVPDAPTAELMSDFYTLLEQNPDKAQALRQAMLKTMKTHPDPRDWAAFTLIGES
ncbi:CHAT domain-containing protein [Pseudanabaena sp. UWO310]|uniref:CHAT domain-containing protein n=1 Tax=Pseudanabaena sp. UWO310 TaxID=2480795 RepID=UPI001CC206D2|nr:CHAT domain-containing tetratricopeptide repeat protein [Pseudanabaena sp. UWO310]